MNLFLADETWLFTAAIGLMLGLAVLEGLGMLLGHGGLSAWIDHFLPHTPDGDGLLGWLHLGKVPFMILVIVFLTAFGLTGFVMQMAARAWFHHFLPLALVAAGAFLVALPAVRLLGGALGKVLPQDETFAVSLEDLVGRIATVVTGTARFGVPAQARVRDLHGRSHYVLVEPDGDAAFTPGTEVLLVRRLSGTRFQSIPNPKPGLLQS